MTSTTKRRWLRTLGAGSLALITAASLAACSTGGGQDNTSSQTQSSTATPKQGGSVTIVAAGPMNSWDPIVQALPTIPGIGTDRMIAVYGALLYVGEDGKVTGSLADSMTTSDNTTWTLKLRDGLKFTDGTPLDADAVKYNWDRAAGEGSALKPTASLFTSEVVDPKTVKLTAAAANPILDRLVAESLSFIASPAALKDQGANYTKPIGAGPFVLKTWDQAVGETFERNPDYFEKGKPYLDELKFTVIADPAQRVTTVVQGGADIMNNYKFALLEVLDSPGTAIYAVKTGGSRHFVFNTLKAPFDNVKARQAVALSVDATELTQTLTQDPDDKGWAGLFPASSPFYDAQYDIKQNDPAAAKKMVDELKAGGANLDIKILAASVPELTRAAQLLQVQLNAAGFNATIQQIALGDWAAAARQRHDFDITFYPGIYDLANPQVAFTNWFEGSENIAGYKSADMTSALDQMRKATSEADQKAAFAKIEQIYEKDLPFVVFGIDERVFFHRTDVDGFTPIGRGMLLSENLFRTDLK